MFSTLRIRSGARTPCIIRYRVRRLVLNIFFFQFSQEHEADRAVALLHPSILGTSIKISPARPRLLHPQNLPAYDDEALIGAGGEGLDGNSDGMWED